VNLDAALKRAKQNGTLSLQSRGLTVFPKEIVKFEELKVGDNWWEAAELQKLDLSNNKIPDIPIEIANQQVSLILLNFMQGPSPPQLESERNHSYTERAVDPEKSEVPGSVEQQDRQSKGRWRVPI